MGDRYAQLYFECTAPLAGQIANIPVNTTAANVDLGTIGPLTLSMGNSDQTPPDGTVGGCIGHIVRFEAVGCTVCVNFGPNANSVSSSNAPNAANTGAPSATNTNLVSAGVPIVGGSYKEWLIHPSTRFMGYNAAAGTGSLVITVSSRGQ